jgi:putative IMPACT (imprinted ancient) family translation regulator
MRKGTELLLEAEYNDVGKVLYLLGNRGVQPSESEYAENVRLKVLLPTEDAEGFQKELTEATAARVKAEKLGETEFVRKEES